MDLLLAALMWALILLFYLKRQECIRQGRPFFRFGTRKVRRAKTQVFVSDQSQQKHNQRVGNIDGVQRHKDRPSNNLSSNQTAPPQKSRQKYSQRSDNTPRVQRYKNRPSINASQKRYVKKERKPPQPTVDRRLIKQLNSLTHDPATSNRLVQSIKAKNPQKSLNWCAEQAVWNIERDRR